MLKLLKIILQTNNPKLELNHIFVDNENFIATDTVIMIIEKHNFDFEKQPFLILNDKAKITIKVEGVQLEEKINYSLANGYPNYKRIILDTNKTKIYEPKYYEFIECLYELQHEFSFIFDWEKYTTKYKKINKLLPKIEKVYYTTENEPLMIIAGEYTIIIMPINLHLIQK